MKTTLCIIALLVAGLVTFEVRYNGHTLSTDSSVQDKPSVPGYRAFAVVRQCLNDSQPFLSWLIDDQGTFYVIPDADRPALEKMKDGEVVQLPPTWPMWHHPVTFTDDATERAFGLEHLHSSATRCDPKAGKEDHDFHDNRLVFVKVP